MGTVVISFFILFGSSYGISSLLLKKSVRIQDPIYQASHTTTGIYPSIRKELNIKGNPKREDWFV
jgi:hypothetical protein